MQPSCRPPFHTKQVSRGNTADLGRYARQGELITSVKRPECPICSGRDFPNAAYLPADSTILTLPPVYSVFHSSWFHWECFYNWPDRISYGQTAFERRVDEMRRSTFHGLLFVDHHVAVFASIRNPLSLTIINSQTGRSTTLSLLDWQQKRVPISSFPTNLHPNEISFLESVLKDVWSRFPDADSIVWAVDWSATERHLYHP